MKSLFVLSLIFFGSFHLKAQIVEKGSINYLDEYGGLKELKVGLDVSQVKGNLIALEDNEKSNKDGRVNYTYVGISTLFYKDNVNITSVRVKTFLNKIEEVTISFNQIDEHKIYNLFREAYGSYSNKSNLGNIYYWDGNRVKLTYNYNESYPVASFTAL